MSQVHDIINQRGIVEARRCSATNKSEIVCFEAAHTVMTDEEIDIDIAHAGFAMASLPHRRTKEAVWEKDGGPIKLLVESGLHLSVQSSQRSSALLSPSRLLPAMNPQSPYKLPLCK